MQVLLLRKLAQFIDGVDLSHHDVGDVFDVTAAEANLLIAERWAQVYHIEVVRGDTRGSAFILSGSSMLPRTEVADGPARPDRTLDRIRQAGSRLEKQRLTQTQNRRAEDRIREELRDSRARTVEKTPPKR